MLKVGDSGLLRTKARGEFGLGKARRDPRFA
jgi:hypothetical protein